jgi:hypothetical protein
MRWSKPVGADLFPHVILGTERPPQSPTSVRSPYNLKTNLPNKTDFISTQDLSNYPVWREYEIYMIVNVIT